MNVEILHPDKYATLHDMCLKRMSLTLQTIHAASRQPVDVQWELLGLAKVMNPTTEKMVKKLAESGGHDPQ